VVTPPFHICSRMRCQARESFPGARFCFAHAPRFDRIPRLVPRARIEHDAWSRNGAGPVLPREVDASLYRMGSPARRSHR
jgi:hypothetical protein